MFLPPDTADFNFNLKFKLPAGAAAPGRTAAADGQNKCTALAHPP
jgi:hypothetical protein